MLVGKPRKKPINGGRMNLVEKYLGEAKLSWANTDKIAKKYKGEYKKNQDKEKGKPWNTYSFKDEDNYQSFVSEMQKNYMNFKANKDSLEVKVWF